MRCLLVCLGLAACGPAVVAPETGGNGDGSGGVEGSTSDDGSSSTGAPASCGDGVVDSGEACDTAGPSDTCNEYCQVPGSLLREVALEGCGGRAVAADAADSLFVLEGECNASAVRLTKTDGAGAILWSDSWTDPGSSYAAGVDVAVDADGNATMVGRAYIDFEGDRGEDYAWVRSYGPDGALLWMNEDLAPRFVRAEAAGVAVDAARNVYVAGYMDGYADSQASLQKLSPNGDELWRVEHEAPPRRLVTSKVAVTPEGGAVLVVNERDGDWSNVFRAHTSTSEAEWSTSISYSLAGRDVLRAIEIAGDGTIAVAADFQHPETRLNTALVLKLTPTGEQVWAWEFATPSNAADLAVDTLGSVFVAVRDVEDPDTEYLEVVRLSPDGQLQWSTSGVAIEPRISRRWGITLDPSQNVVVTGEMGGETWLAWFAR